MRLEYNLKQITSFLKEKKYKIYSKPMQLNIVGIRAAENSIDTFNDAIYVFFNTYNHTFFNYYPATTKPGLHWLQHLINPKGTAILVPGQYKNTYVLGLHKNKYLALKQARPVKVYRDINKNNFFDMDPLSIEEGLFGINIHRASKIKIADKVKKWSAGCQVFQNINDFNYFINICERYEQNQEEPGYFTYTLIDELELINFLKQGALEYSED